MHHSVHVLAHQIIGLPAQHVLGSGVYERGHTVGIDPENPLARRCENKLVLALYLAEKPFSTPPFLEALPVIFIGFVIDGAPAALLQIGDCDHYQRPIGGLYGDELMLVVMRVVGTVGPDIDHMTAALMQRLFCRHMQLRNIAGVKRAHRATFHRARAIFEQGLRCRIGKKHAIAHGVQYQDCIRLIRYQRLQDFRHKQSISLPE
jgi:hypothetical protein